MAGSMCYMSGSIQMENVYLPENEGSIWQWLFGKSVTSVILNNTGPGDGFIGIAAPSLARILPVCTWFLFFFYLLQLPASNLIEYAYLKIKMKIRTSLDNWIPYLTYLSWFWYLCRLIWLSSEEKFYVRYSLFISDS